MTDAPTLRPWLHTREVDAKRRRVLSSTSKRLMLDSGALVGREGVIALGIDPADTGVSRRALTATATDSGWDIAVSNSHGAWIYLWGQAQMWMEPDTSLRRAWPRIGVRVVGGERDLEHWVLLECDGYQLPDPAVEVPAHAHVGTDLVEAPRPLTDTQTEAVLTVFAEHLTWPSIAGPSPLPMSAAARRLGVTETAVGDRLRKVQERAYAFGLHQQRGVSDPEYVHVLARHGYFTVPSPIAKDPTPDAPAR